MYYQPKESYKVAILLLFFWLFLFCAVCTGKFKRKYCRSLLEYSQLKFLPHFLLLLFLLISILSVYGPRDITYCIISFFPYPLHSSLSNNFIFCHFTVPFSLPFKCSFLSSFRSPPNPYSLYQLSKSTLSCIVSSVIHISIFFFIKRSWKFCSIGNIKYFFKLMLYFA